MSLSLNSLNSVAIFTPLVVVLFNKKVIRHKMNRIQAKKHKIRTCEIDKISLSCFDDKKYVLDDCVNIYFHKDCNKKYNKN